MTAALDLERARFNMIEQQIRPWDVLDPQVLELLGKLRRKYFVPGMHKKLAFIDTEIPLGDDADAALQAVADGGGVRLHETMLA